MTKNSQAKILPRKVREELSLMGTQIKLARKRRKLSLAAVAERAQCTQLTLLRVEKGEPTVSMGIYARILYALGLDGDLLLVAQADPAGKAISDGEIFSRGDKGKKEDYNVFD